MGEKFDEIIGTLNDEVHNVYEWLNNNWLESNIAITKFTMIKNKCKMWILKEYKSDAASAV